MTPNSICVSLLKVFGVSVAFPGIIQLIQQVVVLIRAGETVYGRRGLDISEHTFVEVFPPLWSVFIGFVVIRYATVASNYLFPPRWEAEGNFKKEELCFVLIKIFGLVQILQTLIWVANFSLSYFSFDRNAGNMLRHEALYYIFPSALTLVLSVVLIRKSTTISLWLFRLDKIQAVNLEQTEG